MVGSCLLRARSSHLEDPLQHLFVRKIKSPVRSARDPAMNIPSSLEEHPMKSSSRSVIKYRFSLITDSLHRSGPSKSTCFASSRIRFSSGASRTIPFRNHLLQARLSSFPVAFEIIFIRKEVVHEHFHRPSVCKEGCAIRGLSFPLKQDDIKVRRRRPFPSDDTPGNDRRITGGEPLVYYPFHSLKRLQSLDKAIPISPLLFIHHATRIAYPPFFSNSCDFFVTK